MNTRNILTKLSIALALIALATTGAIWEIRRVRAAQPPEPDRTVGMIGVTRGQTVRLNIVNLAIAVDGQIPPDPCRAVLTFRDANGRPFTDEKGNVVRRAVELQAGQSARPFVRVQSEPTDSTGQVPPDPCRATMEVFDNTSGRTSLFSAGFQQPPEPDRTQ